MQLLGKGIIQSLKAPPISIPSSAPLSPHIPLSQFPMLSPSIPSPIQMFPSVQIPKTENNYFIKEQGVIHPISTDFCTDIISIPELQIHNNFLYNNSIEPNNEFNFPIPTFASPAFQASLQSRIVNSPLGQYFSPVSCAPINFFAPGQTSIKEGEMLKGMGDNLDNNQCLKSSDFSMTIKPLKCSDSS